MTIELLNFPDATNTLFKQGDVSTVIVRFTADHAGIYSAIGYQVSVDCKADGNKEVISGWK